MASLAVGNAAVLKVDVNININVGLVGINSFDPAGYTTSYFVKGYNIYRGNTKEGKSKFLLSRKFILFPYQVTDYSYKLFRLNKT